VMAASAAQNGVDSTMHGHFRRIDVCADGRRAYDRVFRHRGRNPAVQPPTTGTLLAYRSRSQTTGRRLSVREHPLLRAKPGGDQGRRRITHQNPGVAVAERASRPTSLYGTSDGTDMRICPRSKQHPERRGARSAEGALDVQLREVLKMLARRWAQMTSQLDCAQTLQAEQNPSDRTPRT
jgi:hypothetical protein